MRQWLARRPYASVFTRRHERRAPRDGEALMSCIRSQLWIPLAAATLAVLGLFACSTPEGVACNPDLFPGESECASGLVCTVPASCANAVCCPASGPSRDPGCAACAADAGSDAPMDTSTE